MAIFTPTIFACGGESRAVTVIANELSKKYKITIYTCEKNVQQTSIYSLNHSIQVVSYFPYGKNPLKCLLRYLYRRTHAKIFETYKILWQYAYYSNGAAKKMQKTIENQYDVVIAVSGNLTILLGQASKKKKPITIGWEHSSYEAYFETPHKYLWKRQALFCRAVKNLDACFVLNEDIAEKYKKNLGIDCSVVYNPRSFVSSQKSSLTHKQFIACGNLVEAKGFDLLIDSFRKYAKMEADWKLVIVGDGPLRSQLEQRVNRYHLEKRIVFIGYVDDVKPFLLNSSVYLLSSRWEGFPMCVTEAFEMGLPVISYDIPAMIPLMKNNEGIKVKRYEINDFSNAMYQLATKPKLRKQMSENAIQMAETISIENIGQQWSEKIDALFEKNRGEP